MRGAVAEVAATFEKQTGHTVKIIAAAPSQIVASLKGGAPADVVVQIDSALPEMEDKVMPTLEVSRRDQREGAQQRADQCENMIKQKRLGPNG
jgi:hypothetical protein